MRENVLRDLVSRAATHRDFLQQARNDLEGTLVRHGYHLTKLAGSLEGRIGGPPARTELARFGSRKTSTTRGADGVRNRVR